MTTTIIVPVQADTTVTSLEYDEWWIPCGCEPSDCLVAYRAVGADSYEDSKINLANPGTYDAEDSGHAPTWTALDGWGFDGGTSNYHLDILSLSVSDQITIIVRHMYYAPGNLNYGLFGYLSTGNLYPYIYLTYTNNVDVGIEGKMGTGYGFYFNTPSSDAVLALNKDGIYVDGVLEQALSSVDPFSGNYDISIGAINADEGDSFYWPFIGNIRSFAVYNKVLTQSQIEQIGNNMP